MCVFSYFFWVSNGNEIEFNIYIGDVCAVMADGYGKPKIHSSIYRNSRNRHAYSIASDEKEKRKNNEINNMDK